MTGKMHCLAACNISLKTLRGHAHNDRRDLWQHKEQKKSEEAPDVATVHGAASSDLLQLLITSFDLFSPLFSLLTDLIINCLGLVVIPCQEELIGLGDVLEEIMLTALLLIKYLRPCLQKAGKSI